MQGPVEEELRLPSCECQSPEIDRLDRLVREIHQIENDALVRAGLDHEACNLEVRGQGLPTSQIRPLVRVSQAAFERRAAGMVKEINSCLLGHELELA